MIKKIIQLHNQKISGMSINPYLVLGILSVVLMLIYPTIFLNFSEKTPFGQSTDAQVILSIISYTIHSPLSFNHLYSLPIYYPQTMTLVGTHPVLGISMFFKIFKFFGLTITQSNNLYILLCLLLGSIGCFLLIKEFVRNPFIALVASGMFMIAPRVVSHMHWLNFLSSFYLPYILFFLIKHFKTKRIGSLTMAIGLMIIQFISSVYLGLHLWAIIVPGTILIGLLLKIVTLKDLKIILLGLFIGGLVLIMLIHPYLIYNDLSEKRNFDKNTLVKPFKLFSDTSLFKTSKDLSPTDKKNLYPSYFPGFVFTFLLLGFFLRRKSALSSTSFYYFIGIIILCVFFTSRLNFLIAEIFILILLSSILFVFVKDYKKFSPFEILIFGVTAIFFILFLNFTMIPGIKSISLYELVYNFLPLGGMRFFARVFSYIFPLIILMAGIGMDRLYENHKSKLSKRTLVVILIVLLSCIVLENYPYRLLQKKPFHSLNNPDNKTLYSKIPFKKNKVILEIPYYFGMKKAENSKYMFNWKYHQNNILNGRMAAPSKSYIKDINKILGNFNLKFPKENTLKTLMNKYSVSHVIFHWDAIKKYTNKFKPGSADNMKKSLKSIKYNGVIQFNSDNHTILKLQESQPQKIFIRTLSSNHLREKKFEIKLNENYEGVINILVNNFFIQSQKVNSDQIVLEFGKKGLKYHILGNKVSIRFDHPVVVKDFSILD